MLRSIDAVALEATAAVCGAPSPCASALAAAFARACPFACRSKKRSGTQPVVGKGGTWRHLEACTSPVRRQLTQGLRFDSS